MKAKRLLIIAILVIIVIIGGFIFNKYKSYKKRADIKIPVLLYHNFVTTVPDEEPDNFNYINTPESFEENIKVLLENGYTVISMKELKSADEGKEKLPSKPILITFDDGYYSNYEYIYPILQKYNVKASIFIVTDKIGKEIDGIKYLSWKNCKEMQDSGLVEICSHSSRHLFYDKFSAREVRDDVIESYQAIEKKFGKEGFKGICISLWRLYKGNGYSIEE